MLSRPVKAKWVQLVIRSVYPGWKYSDTAAQRAARGCAIDWMDHTAGSVLLSALPHLSWADSAAAIPASAAEMPKDFVYLQRRRPKHPAGHALCGPDNFTGRPVPGYDAPECVLVRQAAEALKAVQAELKAKGLSLKVYDCYRPAAAVAAFVAWSKAPDDPNAKAAHYPALAKAELFPQGYIAAVSGHSRGATVDLTSGPARRTSRLQPATGGNALGACTAPAAEREADTSIDMGTGFDCFDAKANTAVSGLSMAQQQNREMLLAPWRATASRTTTRNGGTSRSRTSLTPTRCSISRSSREGRSHRNFDRHPAKPVSWMAGDSGPAMTRNRYRC